MKDDQAGNVTGGTVDGGEVVVAAGAEVLGGSAELVEDGAAASSSPLPMLPTSQTRPPIATSAQIAAATTKESDRSVDHRPAQIRSGLVDLAPVPPDLDDGLLHEFLRFVPRPDHRVHEPYVIAVGLRVERDQLIGPVRTLSPVRLGRWSARSHTHHYV